MSEYLDKLIYKFLKSQTIYPDALLPRANALEVLKRAGDQAMRKARRRMDPPDRRPPPRLPGEADQLRTDTIVALLGEALDPNATPATRTACLDSAEAFKQRQHSPDVTAARQEHDFASAIGLGAKAQLLALTAPCGRDITIMNMKACARDVFRTGRALQRVREAATGLSAEQAMRDLGERNDLEEQRAYRRLKETLLQYHRDLPPPPVTTQILKRECRGFQLRKGTVKAINQLLAGYQQG